MEQSLTGIGVTIEKMTETLAGEERQAVKLSGMLDVGMPIYQEQVYLKKGNYSIEYIEPKDFRFEAVEYTEE